MDKQQELKLNINLDTTPVLFTDNIIMTTNPDGFVINVLQPLMGSNEARVVARIGMSREHAAKFATEMGKLLALTSGQSQTTQVKKKN